MPEIIGYLDPARDAPGVVIPLFREMPQSNIDLIQVVDATGLIVDFREIVPPTAMFVGDGPDLAAEVGDSAIWAFKDHLGGVHYGRDHEWDEIARELLGRSDMFDWPLARLELGILAKREGPNVELQRSAYSSILEDDGHVAADVWRDAEIFAPAVQLDIQEHLHNTTTTPNLFVVLRDEHLEVLVGGTLLARLKGVEWNRTQMALRAMHTRATVVLRALGERSRGAPAPHWEAIGVGGVARFVLKAPPFVGKPRQFPTEPAESGIMAAGPLQSGGASQMFAVCQSKPEQLQLMATVVEPFAPDTYIRHLINVRPFNFGSPPRNRVPVSRLSKLAQDFDHVWLIAAHRQRKTGTYRNQLSVTNAASRLVRSLLLSLTRRADFITELTAAGFSSIPALNLFGLVRPRQDWSTQEWIRNLLHTMLCEEAVLHTAERIVALVPEGIEPGEAVVRVAERKYVVEIIPDPRPRRSSELIGWAVGVHPSNGTAEEFAELCIGLIEGYQWVFRGTDENNALLFEDEGEPLRAWPAHDLDELLRLLQGPSPGGRYDLIITPITLRPDLRRRADDMEWSLIHYSDLPRWFADKHGRRRFVGEDD